MSEITAIESGGEYFSAVDKEEQLGDAFDRMAQYVGMHKLGWDQLAGIYFLVHALFASQNKEDTPLSFQKLVRDMDALSFQSIADDLEALARENPTLPHGEVKRVILNCLQAICTQLKKGYQIGWFFNKNVDRFTAALNQLLVISFVLAEGGFSPQVRRMAETIELTALQTVRFGPVNDLCLLEDTYQLIDLLQKP